MKTVPDVNLVQHIAVCRQRRLPLALLETQTAVAQKAGELLASGGPRPRREQRRIRLLGDVIVIAVKPALRHASRPGKGPQLLIGGVADHVRPHLAVRGPAWWVDPDRHRLLLPLVADPIDPSASFGGD